MPRRHHSNGHRHGNPLEAANHPPAGRVPLGVNVQLYTQRVPAQVMPDGVLVPAKALQVLQLADETGTLMVRYGLPEHIRANLAVELAKPLTVPDAGDDLEADDAG